MKLRNKKTREVGVLEATTYHGGRPDNIIEVYEMGTGAARVLAQYNTLNELLEEWEDYKPAKPLIKDEKIRKTVRAWADGNNIESVHYDAFWTGFRRDNSSITVWEELPLEDNKVYTIAELCGEEEE